MFTRFKQSYPVPSGSLPELPWDEETLSGTDGYLRIASESAGLSLGPGIVRFLSSESGPLAQTLLKDAFPAFGDRAVPFMSDWLGRFFALDRSRAGNYGHELLLFEPGSGEAFEVDGGFESFLNHQLVDEPDTYLESELFGSWLASQGKVPTTEQCVGFRQPLFLGGTGTIENLELVDLEVYWGICGDLIKAVHGIAPGGRIDGVRISEGSD